MPHKLVNVIMAVLLAAAPIRALARSIVGIGIAKSNDYVFTWFDDGMFTEGTSSDLEAYRHAFPYNGDGTTKPSDIVAMSIAGDDHVYTWYRDQTVSEGTSGELTKYSQARKSVTLPPNKTMADIVGIGIAGSDDKVYVWFRDQTVWIGNSRNLTLDGPHPFQLPNDPYNPSAVLTVDDIVEMDIAKDDHVYTWYRNGMHSEGSSGNLARYSTGPYIKARVLYNWWVPLKTLPPGIGLLGGNSGPPPSGFVEPQLAKPPGAAAHPVSGAAGPAGAARQTVPAGAQLATNARAIAAVPVPGLPHSVIMDAPGETNIRVSLPRNALKFPPGPITPYDGTGGPTTWNGPHSVMISCCNDPDPMVAVSDKFMVVTGAASIFFADRQGTALPGMPAAAIPIGNFFSAFTDPSPANEIRLDRNVGFVGACDGPGIPNPTEGHQGQALPGYCVSDFYDARAYFDAASKRFFVVVHAANNIQVDFTGNFSGAQPGSCGYYKIPPNHTKALLSKPEDCLWSRFLIAIAVSKTDDPRDGFHQYVMTQNMAADFPWLAVNGNRVVVNHKGVVAEPPKWPTKMPLVQVLDLNGLASGAHHPAFFTYYPEDLGGRLSVSTPVHHGDTQGVTYLIAGAGQAMTLTIFGIPDSSDPWTAPTPMQVTETLNYDPPASFGSVYRGGKLYFASSRQEDSSSSGVMNSIRVTRLPITRNGNSLSTSTSSGDGFLDSTFGTNNANEDGPNDKFSYDDPSMDVNASGAMLIGYHRGPFQGKALFPEARVSFWPAGAAEPHPSRLVRAGGAPGKITVHYDTTVVDPSDDNTFWVALPFIDNTGNQATTISYIP